MTLTSYDQVNGGEDWNCCVTLKSAVLDECFCAVPVLFRDCLHLALIVNAL